MAKQTTIWKSGREMQRQCTLAEVWVQLSATHRIYARILFGSPFRYFFDPFPHFFNGDYKNRREWYELTKYVQYWIPYTELSK